VIGRAKATPFTAEGAKDAEEDIDRKSKSASRRRRGAEKKNLLPQIDADKRGSRQIAKLKTKTLKHGGMEDAEAKDQKPRAKKPMAKS
jgi:hypothetical protein